MGGGAKIPYPKHVWSPAGGWYCQPANWRANTLIAGGFVLSVVIATWSLSAEREKWTRRPDSSQFSPSRYWSKHLKQMDREWEAKHKAAVPGRTESE